MNHLTLPRFWQHYQGLPKVVQELADKNYELLKSNPYHASLHFKKVGKRKPLWSVRVGEHYRALATEKPEGFVWFWIGPHTEYDKLIAQRQKQRFEETHMKAMILAAGVGSRLDPLTRAIPKPMVPIVNRPVIEHIVLDLKKHGFDDIRVNVHYLGSVIEEGLGDGARLGVNISYAHEDKLWGDAGSVKRSQDFFNGETFLVVGGDDISDIDLSGLMALHREKNAASTIATTLVEDPSQFGIVVTDDDGRITRFLEKPKGGDVFSKMANTGVYVFEPGVFDLIPPDTFYGFGNEVFPQLLAEGRPLYGFSTHSYWKDVGNLQVYRQTNFDALNGLVHLEFGLTETALGIYQGENVQLDPSAEITGPAALGNNVIVGAGAKLLGNVILGDGSIVEAGVTLKDTITWKNARVSAGTHLERCVVGTNAQVQSNVAIFDANIVDPTRLMTAKT